MRRKPTLSLAALLVLALLITGCFGPSAGLFPGGNGSSGTDVTGVANFPGEGVRDSDLEAHVPGEILVGVDSEARALQIAHMLDGELTNYLDPIGVAKITLRDEGASLTDAMRSLKGESGVRYAHANFTAYTLPYVEDEPSLVTDFPTRAGDSVGIGLLDDEGEDEGPKTWYERFQYGPRITRAIEAWDKEITGRDRVIAVIDTGVDPTHPDLAGKVLLGFNPDYAEQGLDPHDTMDFHNHGTHVAATAAGRMNVELGERMTVGIAPDAYVLPLRVFNPAGSSYTSTSFGIAFSIMVAAEPALVGLPHPPADVANMSLGGPVYTQAMQDAVHFATERGTVVVASMGNSENQEVSYPAAYEQVIAVAATDPWDRVTDFSTTGPHTSVGAPGDFVFAAVPGGWAWMSGTSMAAPHVSGAIALLRQHDPSLSPARLKDLLERTADSDGGFSRAKGHGRINIARALENDEEGTQYGVIEVFVHDGFNPVYEANVVLYKDEKRIRTVRTGGAWAYDGEPLYNGTALFFGLEPGDDYSIVVGLDENLHGGDATSEPISNIRVKASEATHVNVFVRP